MIYKIHNKEQVNWVKVLERFNINLRPATVDNATLSKNFTWL